MKEESEARKSDELPLQQASHEKQTSTSPLKTNVKKVVDPIIQRVVEMVNIKYSKREEK